MQYNAVFGLFIFRLQYLSLAKIYGLTDYAMSILAREATSMRHLNIRGCWRLSDDSIRQVHFQYTNSSWLSV